MGGPCRMLLLLVNLALSVGPGALAAPPKHPPTAATAGETASTISLLMPNVQPKVDDTYLCYPMNLDKMMYITGFKPQAHMTVAHHMLLYGCAEPGRTGKPWNCGEMQTSTKSNYKRGPVCKTPGSIVYAWGMDAPELKLPANVGFKVGGDTGINSLVLQVHYLNVSSFLPPNNGKDSSGVVLTVTKTPQRKTAGVYLLGTDGVIPGHSTTYMETACTLDEDVTLHPFAFRGHAHKLGEIVSGYRVRDGQWAEIGRVSPQQPQMFYPVSSPDLTIRKGDILAARCTMVNKGEESVKVGPTSKDEMCNFYMMYYIDGDKVVKDGQCFSPGPPSFRWASVDGIHPENAPRSASMIPDTSTVLEDTARKVEQLEQEISRQEQELEDGLRRIWMNDAVDDQQETGPRANGWNTLGDSNPSQFGGMFGEQDAAGFPSLDDFNNLDIPARDRFVEQFQPLYEPAVGDFEQPEKPYKTERVSFIEDKANGGKGYEKTQNVFKQLDVPGGKGFYKASSKQTGYSWSSDARPDGDLLAARRI